MACFWILLLSLSCSFSLALLWRLHRERSDLRRTMAGSGRRCRLLVLIEHLVDDAIDRDLLAETGPGGLAEITLRFREPHDRFKNVAELLGSVAQLAEMRSTSEMVHLIK